jgi:N-acetylmuramoyl-L-alanine amidase
VSADGRLASVASGSMKLIAEGSLGLDVRDVQARLRDLGYEFADDAGVFGNATRIIVRTFQQERGLPADGIVGPDTWRALVDASFRLGDRMLYVTRPLLSGDDVRELQQRLNRLGFDAGRSDGLYGHQTFEAVREFQMNVGAPADGITGPATLNALRQLHRQHQTTLAFAARERHLLSQVSPRSMAGIRIMVDPGLGPDATGAISANGLKEHEVNWKIASLVEGQLAAMGIHVVLSRGPATTPSVAERAEHANTTDVEVILSIHCNALDSSEARGAAAYYYGSNSAYSERGMALAQLILDRMTSSLDTADCRIHTSTTAIHSASRAVAVTVEPGFLTHPVEGIALTRNEYQWLTARAIVDGLTDFLIGGEARTAVVSVAS